MGTATSADIVQMISSRRVFATNFIKYLERSVSLLLLMNLERNITSLDL